MPRNQSSDTKTIFRDAKVGDMLRYEKMRCVHTFAPVSEPNPSSCTLVPGTVLVVKKPGKSITEKNQEYLVAKIGLASVKDGSLVVWQKLRDAEEVFEVKRIPTTDMR